MDSHLIVSSVCAALPNKRLIRGSGRCRDHECQRQRMPRYGLLPP